MPKLMGEYMLRQEKVLMPGAKYNAPIMTNSVVVASSVKTQFGLPPEARKITRRKSGNGSIIAFTVAKVAMMNEYEFVLRFQLPAENDQPEEFLDSLYEAGCDDAVVGIGLPGYIALDFCREAASAHDAVQSAISNIQSAIPAAKLIEVAPDLLNTSEIADLVSSHVGRITRQAMRKYAFGQVAKVKSRFPAAAISSSSPLWHVDEVIRWLVENEKAGNPAHARKLIETSQAARAMNARLQWQAVKKLVPKLKLTGN